MTLFEKCMAADWQENHTMQESYEMVLSRGFVPSISLWLPVLGRSYVPVYTMSGSRRFVFGWRRRRRLIKYVRGNVAARVSVEAERVING